MSMNYQQAMNPYAGATIVQPAQNCALTGSAAPEISTLSAHLVALVEILNDAQGIGVRLRSFADRLYGPMPQDPRSEANDIKDQPIAAQRLSFVAGSLQRAMTEIRDSLDRIERFA